MMHDALSCQPGLRMVTIAMAECTLAMAALVQSTATYVLRRSPTFLNDRSHSSALLAAPSLCPVVLALPSFPAPLCRFGRTTVHSG